MTPKDKALDIVNEFRRIEDERGFRLIRVPYAKMCALIAVDEILEMNLPILEEDADEFYDYWEQVKKEINNL